MESVGIEPVILVVSFPGGDIEYLGRVDHQVKVAGHRVEPGEVETVMTSMAGVSEAGVVTWTKDDVARLAAFVVTARNVDELRSELATELPPWLVPTIITAVSEIPRNQNGKVDRERLRERAMAWGSEATTSESTMDVGDRARLTDLGIPPATAIHADVPLVEQGLDSLGAIRVQIRARTQFKSNIAVDQILKASPVELLQLPRYDRRWGHVVPAPKRRGRVQPSNLVTPTREGKIPGSPWIPWFVDFSSRMPFRRRGTTTLPGGSRNRFRPRSTSPRNVSRRCVTIGRRFEPADIRI